MKIPFKKLSSTATIPTRADSGAAGYDLYAAEAIIVPARDRQLVKTDIAVALPAGTYGRIAPRSGLAWKKGLDVGAGVCDHSYVGNIGVVLFNHTDDDYEIAVGDRIAQLIITIIITPEPEEVDELPTTERGSGGFGSTGK